MMALNFGIYKGNDCHIFRVWVVTLVSACKH